MFVCMYRGAHTQMYMWPQPPPGRTRRPPAARPPPARRRPAAGTPTASCPSAARQPTSKPALVALHSPLSRTRRPQTVFFRALVFTPRFLCQGPFFPPVFPLSRIAGVHSHGLSSLISFYSFLLSPFLACSQQR